MGRGKGKGEEGKMGRGKGKGEEAKKK